MVTTNISNNKILLPGVQKIWVYLILGLPRLSRYKIFIGNHMGDDLISPIRWAISLMIIFENQNFDSFYKFREFFKKFGNLFFEILDFFSKVRKISLVGISGDITTSLHFTYIPLTGEVLIYDRWRYEIT